MQHTGKKLAKWHSGEIRVKRMCDSYFPKASSITNLPDLKAGLFIFKTIAC